MKEIVKEILKQTFVVNYADKHFEPQVTTQGCILKKDIITLIKEMDIDFFDYFDSFKSYDDDSVTLILTTKTVSELKQMKWN